MGIEDGGDLTPIGRGATDPGVSTSGEPPRLAADPLGPAGAQAPVPTGLAGGPSPAAWGWTPSTPPAYWPGGAATSPRSRLPVVATLLAVGAGITFFLPWATFEMSLSPSFAVPDLGFSASLTTMLENADWSGHLWPYLVVLGFLLALSSAFLDSFFRLDRRAAIAEALGFGALASGVVVAIVSKFNSWAFGSLIDGLISVSPGFGAWLCLVVAVAGAIVAVVRFANPNAFMGPVAAPAAGPASGWIPPEYPTPPYSPQFAAPYPPYASPYPSPYPPQYPPTWSPSAPFSHAPQPATPVPFLAPAQTPSIDPPGVPGTLVVLLAGQTTTRTVRPGEMLLVGRDPNSGIVLEDPGVSPRHASVERRGPGWLVRDLDVANPIWLLDATGRAQPIRGELGLRSGVLLIGSAQVRLYPT